MKKILPVFCLAMMLCLGLPANASPHGGHGPRNHIVAGPHHGPHHGYHGHNWGAPPPPPPRHHYYGGNRVFIGGGYGYYPYCDYRFGGYETWYYPRHRNNMYINVGFPVRF